MSERRLAAVLTRRFTRVAWTGLAGYALLVVALFAAAAEMALRRSLEHSADLTQSLLGAYRDSTSEPGGVMPSALADQLVAMGGQVVITRTTTAAGGKQQVYFVSPDMPAKRLEGLPANASPVDVRRALLAAIAQRSRWRYRVLHRSAGAFDIYVVASRESYVVALGALAAAAALLLPGAGLAVARGARQAVAGALRPLERVAAETRAIGPAELGTRLTSPTGQTEVTELADSVNRMLERVDRAHRALQAFTADASHELRTPLTHLRARVQWAMAEGRTEGEMREALAAMERVLDQTAKLVEELLLIARGENRQLALAHTPFELGAVVNEVREITEAMALERELAVGATPSPPRWALGDADRTRHILLYAERQHHVRARAQRQDGGGERARHGAGHRRGACRADLRPLFPRRSVAQSRSRGHRARTGDRAPPGRAARRPYHCRLVPRRRQHLHRVAARGGVAARLVTARRRW